MKRFFLTLTTFFLISTFSPSTNASEFKTVALNIYQDTYSDSQDILKTSSTEKYMKVGNGDQYRSYLKYSTQALDNLGVLPQDIISSNIHIYHNYLNTFYQVYLELYEARENWVDTNLNFNNKPSHLNTKLYRSYIPKNDGWISMDITETTKKHLENNNLNKGFVLKQGNSDLVTNYFWSRNCRVVSELPKCTGDKIPYVSVTYWPNNPPTASTLLSPINNFKTEAYTNQFSWEQAQDVDDESIVYRLEIASDELFTDIFLSTQWLEQTTYEHTFHTDNTYYWRVISKDEHIEQYGSSMSETWSLEIGEVKETEEEEIIEETPIIDIDIPVQSVISATVTPKKPYTPPPIKPVEEPILTEVLGAQTSKPKQANKSKKKKNGSCKYRYNISTNKVIRQSCDFPQIQTDSIEYNRNSFGVYEIQVKGNILQKISTTVDIVRCKKKTFWDPRTWKGCVEIGNTTINENIASRNIVQVIDKDNNLLDLNYHQIDNDGNFNISYTSTTDSSELYIRTVTYLSIKLPEQNIWIDDNVSSSSTKLDLPKVIEITNNKPFRFPFSNNIGVTQWHGYTDYQSPHTGIDFGATKEKIYALSDGYIRAVMWDNYYGTCLSGGNVMRVEYDNGMHSVFMHLKDYKKSNGQNWRVGDKVKKGELLATSGNSGAYNCQKLSYHLHLEIRETKSQSSHIDPVKYISTNWAKVPTLQYTSYPGRLSGDNPHPGR